MREIEFRAKAKNKNAWIYGDLIHDENGYSILSKKEGCLKIKPNTIGQYTGLKDKNGQKIFEGDIVKCFSEDFNETVGQGVHEVIFETRNKTAYFGVKKDEKSVYGFTCDFTPANKCEVIGNIYDNPELLKEVQNV